MKIRSFVFTASFLLAAAGGVHAQSPGPTPGYVGVFKPSENDSLQARQARTAGRLSRHMVSGETQLLHSFAGMYQEVWQNADGLTPQQVCDALGTKAGSLFVIAGTMANALYTIDPAGVGTMVGVPAGYAVTIHADGTVTLQFSAPGAGVSPSPLSSGAH